MKNLIIDEDFLYMCDSNLQGQDNILYEREIRKIVDNFWKGIGEHEELLSPFFTQYLEVRALYSLYISYFSFGKINSKYDRINVNASTVITDIVGEYYNFNFSSNCEYFDDDLGLLPADSFLYPGNKFKKFIRKFKYLILSTISKYKGVEVIYLNAGKLDNDFSKLSNAYNCIWLTNTKSERIKWDVENLKKTIRGNINELSLSIPNHLIIELLERRIFDSFEFYLNKISVFVDFIEKNNVKLAIASAINDEGFLALLAAAKLTKIDSLTIPHGAVYRYNPKLDNYCTYQAVLNEFEPKYIGAKQFYFRMRWFD